MKLLHTEIDVVPGRRPQKQPLPEGYVGAGTAVLRITNTTARQNAYTVRIRCEEPFWQDAWVQITALPPTGGPENQPPAGKPDQPGPRNQSITIYVQDRGTRDVFLAFFVPEKSECRAGAYPVKVVIETRIVSNDPQEARKERITEIPATVIVRPFYKWSISYAPEDRRVGFFKRGKEYEVVVENQGNDWLYCDLRMPRPQNVLVETTTARLAVPPPEPGADSIRTVPFKAISRVHNFRGTRQPMPLPITVQRVHAPTVPPLPEEAQFGPSGANVGAAVIESETTDVGTPEVPATLTYCPLIPSTLTGFLQALAQNARGIIFVVIGGILAWNMAVFTWEYFFRTITEFHSTTTQVELGKPFKVKGRNLAGSMILIFDQTGKNQISEPIMPKPGMDSLTQSEYTVTLKDQSLNHKLIRIGAQRLGSMTFLKSFLPVEKDTAEIQVGTPPEQPGAPASAVLPPTIAPGQPLEIGGVSLGDASKQGKVLLNGQTAKVLQWTDSKIVVQIDPGKFQEGVPFSVAVYDAKGNLIPITGSNDVEILTPQPGSDTSTTGPTTSDSATGPTSSTTGPSTSNSSTGPTSSSTTQPNPVVPPGPTTPPFAGEGALLSGNYAGALRAANGTTATDLAVRAVAAAYLNRPDEAVNQMINDANKALGSTNTGNDAAMVFVATALVAQKRGVDFNTYLPMFDQAGQAAKDWAFVDIAEAMCRIQRKEYTDAGYLLNSAGTKNPNKVEQAAINRMIKIVASHK
ncbi:MAG TPA: IPT/TIG domain-containing protein [Fimbriimonadaceae bacterium]|nr:IPT/TIG domain-containing protein [Fimbriimonadaceae bacterium]